MPAQIPKLMLGTSPFIGAAQFGRKAYDYRRLAIKPLAAGSLKPTESLFKFIYRYAVSITVGIASEAEMEETYPVAKKCLNLSKAVESEGRKK